MNSSNDQHAFMGITSVICAVAACGGAPSGNPSAAHQAEPAQAGASHQDSGIEARVALLVRLEAKPGKEAEVARFLESGLPIVDNEPATSHWFALKLGPTTFGIFDTFPDDAGRQAHLQGKVAEALMANAPTLLAEAPTIEQVSVIARKDAWKASESPAPIRLGLLARLEAKPGKEAEVVSLLKSGLALVEDEPGTPIWFGIQLSPTTLGIFDAFPDEASRQAHLDGQLAHALLSKAPELLATPPTIEAVEVLAAKLPH